MSAERNGSDISELAYVDADGRYIDGVEYAYVNLRFPRLSSMLHEMACLGEDMRRLIFPSPLLRPLLIEKLDSTGCFWRIRQEKSGKTGKEDNPSVRFFFDPKEAIIRPVDYRDPHVTLEGNRRTSQLLIASFMMHWLSALLSLHSGESDGATIGEPGSRRSHDERTGA
ncbi:MAG: hypothetical protein ACLFN0_07245 [Thermovirgaceae bacterium]